MLAHLLCTQRHTITGLLHTLGRQEQDWSKAYRLYREHVDQLSVFGPVFDGVLERLPEGDAVVIAVDDSHFRKSGQKVALAGWYRDPLGPAFHTNLIWSQRFIQFSVALPDPSNAKRSVMIPIAVAMIPKLPKPAKDATEEDWKHYEKLRAMNTPGYHAVLLLQKIREHLNAFASHAKRHIWVCGDGDYTNSTLLPALPERTIYIGRTRMDINLREVPEAKQERSAGRPRSYGEKLQTPQELLKDHSVAWEQLRIGNGEQTTCIRYKRIARARWQTAGEKTVVQVVVIAPLRYRKRKNGPWRYTKPAYLVCTDAHIRVQDLIQAYFWRWGIEVNFKEQKQLFGAGHAQVRNETSATSAPAVCIASYAALLLAGIRTYGFDARPPSLSPPKWYKKKHLMRTTSSDLIRQMHNELMLSATGNFSPLVPTTTTKTSGKKFDGRVAA